MSMTEQQTLIERVRGSGRSSDRLQRYLGVIQDLFANSTDMIWVTHGDRFIWSNAEAARQLGFDSPQQLVGLTPADISPERQPDGALSSVRALKEINCAHTHGQNRFEWCHSDRRGGIIPCEIIITAIPVVNDVVMLAVGRNLRMVKEVERRLELSQRLDPLTGLPNRRALMDEIEAQVADSGEISLVCIGLDQFNRVNEEFGFRSGDKVLNLVSQRLAKCLDKRGMLARFHGDTFMVLLTHCTVSEAVDRAGGLLEQLRRPFSLGGVSLGLQCSLGLSLLCEAKDSKTLLQHAEAAMFQAKRSGGNRLCCYSTRLAEQQAMERNLVNEIREALERQEFFLMYQPVFHLDSGVITGAEALLRWRHPMRGILSPDDFVDQAERNGQIVEIGRQVLEMACRQMKLWLDRGLPVSQMSVNISVSQIESGDLVEHLLATLKRHQVPPEMLEIEVTESMLAHQGEPMAAQLWKLRQAGVAVAIDDFGTGYSSFGRLKSLPVDRVKIDRSFVRELENDERNASIIQAIIALAHNLEMVVTAEGIETDYQYQFLLSHRCECGQGFLISAPVTPVRFEDLVRHHWKCLRRTINQTS
ncbi:bifunctional diguanylate cyclase/phosphodiesterase [Ferrimonas sediminicola]|uniref:Bifunctional diguanylate cyclase/phosphodiesterase n=1 Tax=Ferrimonas sediminicola TaxID=2569538 RepID=A0A4U1BG24_9GAMM|nr:bifunctional diguanylate cyclase/phosphodiesterase [Ferrimonas sediminicola]TKB50252.1 bifunctional diguanylate cyclase/phosphodiesterase [Ferrimonas sediminicola]